VVAGGEILLGKTDQGSESVEVLMKSIVALRIRS
jgi:hypothetical protein